MAKEPPQTIGDLRQKTIIRDKEISAATDALSGRTHHVAQTETGRQIMFCSVDAGAGVDLE